MTNNAETKTAGAGAAGGAAGAAGAGVAILGFGTAAMNALIALRHAGYDGPVNVFTDGGELPYSPILTSYYAGGEKEYAECFPWSEAEAACLAPVVHAGCAVEALCPEEHVVRTAEGDFAYEKCLVATGSRPMAYGFPQVEGGEYEPLMLRTMEDAERLRAALSAPACRRILVSGASMVALKTLEAALNENVQVTLVGMNPQVLDVTAHPAAAARIEARLRDFGVELRLGQTIRRVEWVCAAEADAPEADAPEAPAPEAPAAARRLKVTFSNGDADVFDEISVSHGMRSNLGFLAPGALEQDRALLVDEFMRTSDPDVYAAGDVAQALELTSGERRVVGLWKTAALQGACAGAAMAAELAGAAPAPAQAYEGAIATNTIAVKDSLFLSAGISQPAEGLRDEVEERDDMTIVRIWAPAAPEERLVGFDIACDHDEPGGLAYDLGAMLTMRILQGVAR